jgi:hypothetical protein
MHIHIQGNKHFDKKSKASRDRMLVLQAIDEDAAAAWLDILKEWIRYLNF